MSYPKTFPNEAALHLANFATNPTKPDAQFASATYEVLGYALYLYFGDPVKVVGISDPVAAFKARELVDKIRDIVDDPAFRELPILEIAALVASLYTGGVPVWRIGITLVTTYGIKILPLVRKVIALI